MTFVAIDPGPEFCAWCILDDHGQPVQFAKEPTGTVLASEWAFPVAIEMVASYGMAVGAEVFETCVVIGRLMEKNRAQIVRRVKRLEVKTHLCHRANANDSNIRQAIIDRFGGKEKAIGNKKNPGPLYGMAGDCWAALAVALYAHDTLIFSKPTTETP